MQEFKAHFKKCLDNGALIENRQLIFEAWIIQKITGI